MSKKTLPSNYPDQHNRNNQAFWKDRGYDHWPADWATRPAVHQQQPTAPGPGTASDPGDKK